jgi:hypothetical protein
MQAVVVLMAGMVFIGSILLHLRRFQWPAVMKAGKVAAFVYISLIAGLFLFDFNGVMAFQSALIKVWVHDPAQGSLFDKISGLAVIYWFTASAISLTAVIFQQRRVYPELMNIIILMTMGATSMALFTQGDFPTVVLNWLLTTTCGNVVTFCLLLLVVGAANTLLGIIFVGLNVALLVIQLVKGEAINLFSLLGLLELAHVDGVLVALTMMFITTVIGALEFAIQHFDFGTGHL